MGPEPLRTLYWEKGRLFLLDQRLLPGKIRYLECGTAKDVVKAIKEMVVRGAPAIGISAAFGMVLAVRELSAVGLGPAEMRERLEKSAETLRNARPTAVNLHWALRRMVRRIEGAAGASTEEVMAALEEEALALLDEDISANRRIGAHGEPLIPDGASILTHCNAGALATAGYGTALELHHEKIPATLVTDSCAGYLMAAGKVDLVITGADRIAANGDTANKIGTYMLAVLAQRHGIPFYIAAPCSTIDLSLEDGGSIVIEERDPAEVTTLNGQEIAPAGIDALNPAFDVTPAELISALITERGVLHRPDRAGLVNLLAKGER